MGIYRKIYNTVSKLIGFTLIVFIIIYRKTISPMTKSSCRFYPTCSQYALEAIKHHGPWIGTWLSIKRLLKCHPRNWGGYDPVPKNKALTK